MNNKSIDLSSYPLLENRPDLIKSAKGTPLSKITIENILSDTVDFDDCKIHRDTLIYQAEIAELSGNYQLGENFRRAAELTSIPDDFVLKTYNSIRPFRSSREEILEIADKLQNVYNAQKCSAFVRESLAILEKSNQLKENSI